MKPPIIIYDWQEVSIYSTVEEAEHHLEGVDVLAGEYLAFDSEGRVLELGVDTWTHQDGGLVVIRPATESSSFAYQLRHVLLTCLQSSGIPRRQLKRAELSQLIDIMRTHEDSPGSSIYSERLDMEPIIVVQWTAKSRHSRLFVCAEAAAKTLPIAGVTGGEYLAFDCTGRMLELTVHSETSQVVIKPLSTESLFIEQTRLILLTELSNRDVPVGDTLADLSSLIKQLEAKS